MLQVFAAFDGVRPESLHADPLPLGVEERAQVIVIAEHYMKYALGSYGWMLYSYRKGGRCFSCTPCAIGELCTCWCRRYGSFFGAQNDRGAPGHRGDNCCRTNHSALLRTVWEFGSGGGQSAKGPAPDSVPPPRSECRVVYASWTVSVDDANPLTYTQPHTEKGEGQRHSVVALWHWSDSSYGFFSCLMSCCVNRLRSCLERRTPWC
jgi:hypothetical protein